MSNDQETSKPSRASRIDLRNLLIGILVVAVCLGAIAFFTIRTARRNAELERLAEQDEVTTKEIIRKVEAVRKKLGRAPKDQAELELLMGKPMPEVYPRGYPTKVFYFRTTDNSYFLYYPVSIYHDRYYDSVLPKAGWLLRSND